MKYNVVIFGVKDTTEEIVEFIQNSICKIDLIVTIHSSVLAGNQVAGYKGLSFFQEKYGIEVFETKAYSLNDVETGEFFKKNEFGIGISMGWQRLIPSGVLNRFEQGVFGFHGSCAYLPFGRGRSPLNWSVIRGDSRFILNMFRYDERADSPNVFSNQMFAINEHDSVRTLQYKNLLVSKNLIKRLLEAYKNGNITINRQSNDFDGWYQKRTPEDGKIDFRDRTRNIYNLVRGVTKPFPGAYACCKGEKIIVWKLHPFDEMLDFSAYTPGEIIDVFDSNLIVRTVDGSVIIEEYDCSVELTAGDRLV